MEQNNVSKHNAKRKRDTIIFWVAIVMFTVALCV